MSWNRLYRPRSFSQLHLQTVKESLLQLLVQPRLPQAYLFAGPKGTGKTSASRILSAVLNDPRNAALVTERLSQTPTAVKGKVQALLEPNESDELVTRILSGRSLTVHELDAASNRGIDDIRALKERVYIPAQEGSVSVFILDEAHMLTTEASNALLKILEEPPSNVVFILATTEAHKILPTIVSRCHTVTFTRATTTEIANALQIIAEAEAVQSDPDALTVLAQQAEGSFRDAVKLLEAVASADQKLTVESVQMYLGSTGLDPLLNELIAAVVQKNATLLSTTCQKLRTLGITDQVVHKKLLELLHLQLMIGLGVIPGEPSWSVPIVQFLLHELSKPDLAYSAAIPLLTIELACLDIIARAQKKQGIEPPASGMTTATQSQLPVANEKKQAKPAGATNKTVATTGNGKTLCARWSEFVELVAQANVTLGAFLKSAEPLEGSEGSAVIRVFYSFHKDQLLNSKSQALLQRFISQLCGGTLDLHIEVSPAAGDAVVSTSATTALPALAAAELL